MHTRAWCGGTTMRTTIEIKPEHRAKHLELAARRGAKGFSTLAGEGLEAYFRAEADREALRRCAVCLKGGCPPVRRGAYGRRWTRFGSPGDDDSASSPCGREDTGSQHELVGELLAVLPCLLLDEPAAHRVAEIRRGLELYGVASAGGRTDSPTGAGTARRMRRAVGAQEVRSSVRTVTRSLSATRRTSLGCSVTSAPVLPDAVTNSTSRPSGG